MLYPALGIQFSLMFAAAAMSFSSVSVIGNALRRNPIGSSSFSLIIIMVLRCLRWKCNEKDLTLKTQITNYIGTCPVGADCIP